MKTLHRIAIFLKIISLLFYIHNYLYLFSSPNKGLGKEKVIRQFPGLPTPTISLFPLLHPHLEKRQNHLNSGKSTKINVI